MKREMYTLEMIRREGQKETSEHMSESEAFLEAGRKLTQASGAGFMMYKSALCYKDNGITLWKIKVL